MSDREEILRGVILLSLVSLSYYFGYREDESENICTDKRSIIRTPDYHGNIQGDTLCMPERDSYGYPNNPFR